MVSIAAFQAVDLGSIPGRRNEDFNFQIDFSFFLNVMGILSGFVGH